MKDSMRAKIDEARASGRDIPLVIEELMMHLAEGMDGPAKETAAKPADKPADKIVSEKPAEKPVEKPADKAADVIKTASPNATASGT